MTTEVTIFHTPKVLGSQVIRVVDREGEPWFIRSDIAKALGRKATQAIGRSLAEDQKGVYVVYTLGGPQSLSAVSESGLYRILMRSNSKNARPFQDWVTREVLPRIRKTGSYVQGEERLDQPGLSLSDLEALQEQMTKLLERKAAILEARVAELTAKVQEQQEVISANVEHATVQKYVGMIGQYRGRKAKARLGMAACRLAKQEGEVGWTAKRR